MPRTTKRGLGGTREEPWDASIDFEANLRKVRRGDHAKPEQEQANFLSLAEATLPQTEVNDDAGSRTIVPDQEEQFSAIDDATAESEVAEEGAAMDAEAVEFEGSSILKPAPQLVLFGITELSDGLRPRLEILDATNDTSTLSSKKVKRCVWTSENVPLSIRGKEFTPNQALVNLYNALDPSRKVMVSIGVQTQLYLCTNAEGTAHTLKRVIDRNELHKYIEGGEEESEEGEEGEKRGAGGVVEEDGEKGETQSKTAEKKTALDFYKGKLYVRCSEKRCKVMSCAAINYLRSHNKKAPSQQECDVCKKAIHMFCHAEMSKMSPDETNWLVEIKCSMCA